jgi:hypothetical protein
VRHSADWICGGKIRALDGPSLAQNAIVVLQCVVFCVK